MAVTADPTSVLGETACTSCGSSDVVPDRADLHGSRMCAGCWQYQDGKVLGERLAALSALWDAVHRAGDVCDATGEATPTWAVLGVIGWALEAGPGADAPSEIAEWADVAAPWTADMRAERISDMTALAGHVADAINNVAAKGR